MMLHGDFGDLKDFLFPSFRRKPESTDCASFTVAAGFRLPQE